ncbi:hypothetical protein HADU_02580 [Acinetobacter sp. HA]|nr:hypothetical protein HADU_02580 [Acinetobacter sp. HA]
MDLSEKCTKWLTQIGVLNDIYSSMIPIFCLYQHRESRREFLIRKTKLNEDIMDMMMKWKSQKTKN